MSTAGVALIMMAWTSSSNVSQPANAAIQSSSVSIPSQKTDAQQSMPDEGYQLYLGAYPSELGARLLWAGLEADPGTMLVGLDPLFERTENEQGTFYSVLVSTLLNHEEADRHCDWLRERSIACSLLGG